MAEFSGTDWRGSVFDRVDFSGSEFRGTNLRKAWIRGADLTGVVMRGVELVDVSIDGEIVNLVINGVDVAPLITAELDRRDPDRVRMRPATADGFREAWALLESLWAGTVARARALPPALLHESVDGEWSFIETLRHLVFATDSWVRRAVQGERAPWHPLGLPWSEMTPIDGVPCDRAARPSLEEVLHIRADRTAGVRDYLSTLTDDELNRQTEPCQGPGWPPENDVHPVRTCLRIVLNEEWEHRRYAERDLDALGA